MFLPGMELFEEKTRRLELSYPFEARGVEVVYTKDVLEAETWLRDHIVDCSTRAVGFDMEWEPQFVSKKRGGTENETAVLQLGVETSCLVLHIYHMSVLPNSLKSILRDENILKIGSDIQKDASKFARDRGLVCKGLVDTQAMAKSFGIQKVGLKALAEHFLGVELDKGGWFSNWGDFPLKSREIQYAALDAWIGLKIYQEMKRQKHLQDLEFERIAQFLLTSDTSAYQHDELNPGRLRIYHQDTKTETSSVSYVWFLFLSMCFLLAAFVFYFPPPPDVE